MLNEIDSYRQNFASIGEAAARSAAASTMEAKFWRFHALKKFLKLVKIVAVTREN